ncbi:methyl-accepting chemotaxis protein [Bradyrhizobium yuanmingense]|uniref:methyl-accepting chemotaxis protein n=1 Tax=Bradyrhizobium yuanmingense TaxID=108015 RepID=UPI0023BA181B|nr:methyl-accepting chemotaxis protein [Bradyrhizobium yuanmingense]MDF0516676.1 methyl-accepting chemotaxis protein [Bradyrhizobium yuanmingense]
MSALIKSHRPCSRMHWNVMQASTIANRFTEILSKASLLALTASVEAAHAGNDDRRFDLVAREVKLPAKRTAKTNSEIAGQIAGSGRTVAQLYRLNQQLILIVSYRFYRWVLLRGAAAIKPSSRCASCTRHPALGQVALELVLAALTAADAHHPTSIVQKVEVENC